MDGENLLSLLLQTPPLPGSWHFTCQRLAVSERELKRRLAVSCWDALSVLWMKSAAVRRSSGLQCRALSSSWLRHECSLECMLLLPQSTQGREDSCTRLDPAYDCFKGWCNLCNVKGKVRNEWIQRMLWHNLFLSYILLLAFILVPCHMRSGISFAAVWLAWFPGCDAEVSRRVCV